MGDLQDVIERNCQIWKRTESTMNVECRQMHDTA